MSKRREARRAREQAKALARCEHHIKRASDHAYSNGVSAGEHAAARRIETWNAMQDRRSCESPGGRYHVIQPIHKKPEAPILKVPWPMIQGTTIGLPRPDHAFELPRLRIETFHVIPMRLCMTLDGYTSELRWWNYEPESQESRRNARPDAMKALHWMTDAIAQFNGLLHFGFSIDRHMRAKESLTKARDALYLWAGLWKNMTPGEIENASQLDAI